MWLSIRVSQRPPRNALCFRSEIITQEPEQDVTSCVCCLKNSHQGLPINHAILMLLWKLKSYCGPETHRWNLQVTGSFSCPMHSWIFSSEARKNHGLSNVMKDCDWLVACYITTCKANECRKVFSHSLHRCLGVHVQRTQNASLKKATRNRSPPKDFFGNDSTRW